MRLFDIALCSLFLLSQVAFLHRVPGLLGDEASEGENVYQILHDEKSPIIGERSYIGVLTDYVRMPFVVVFGYSVLAIRIPMFIASIAVFFMAKSLLYKHLGEIHGSMALVFFLFSPIYILYQRLGWAITALPLFIFLLAYCLQSSWKYKWLISGLIAGIGLQTHLLFLPSLAALIIVSWILYRPNILKTWPFVLGFWAGFGLQFGVLKFMTEDQGDVSQTTQLFGERMADLWHSLPLYISGSSFVAQYTGIEFSSVLIAIITVIIASLIIIALFFVRKKIVWLLTGFILIHTPILLYMVDRYSLRYFVALSLVIWLLAGIGVGYLVELLSKRFSRVASIAPVVFAVFFITWMIVLVLVPFLQSGGSVRQFALGNRTTSANAFVDHRTLIACLRNKGAVFSESEPIQNILRYTSHRYPDLVVLEEVYKKDAEYIVTYAKANQESESLCPEAKCFVVTQRSR